MSDFYSILNVEISNLTYFFLLKYLCLNILFWPGAFLGIYSLIWRIISKTIIKLHNINFDEKKCQMCVGKELKYDILKFEGN